MLHKSCLKLLSALLTQPIRFGSCSAVVPYLQKSEIKTNVKLIILEGSQLKKILVHSDMGCMSYVKYASCYGWKMENLLRKGSSLKWKMENYAEKELKLKWKNYANLLRKGSNLKWKMKNYVEERAQLEMENYANLLRKGSSSQTEEPASRDRATAKKLCWKFPDKSLEANIWEKLVQGIFSFNLKVQLEHWSYCQFCERTFLCLRSPKRGRVGSVQRPVRRYLRVDTESEKVPQHHRWKLNLGIGNARNP